MGHRAAIYSRISEDRTGAGVKVEDQERDCRALAERLGLAVADGLVFADNDLTGAPREEDPARLPAAPRGHPLRPGRRRHLHPRRPAPPVGQGAGRLHRRLR
jgi:hypothetical protein